MEGENEIWEFKLIEQDDSGAVAVSCHEKETTVPDGTSTTVYWDVLKNTWTGGTC